MKKKIILIAFTHGHLMMLRELYNVLNIDKYEIVCYFSGYLYKDKKELQSNFECRSYFFDDHFILANRFRILDILRDFFRIFRLKHHLMNFWDDFKSSRQIIKRVNAITDNFTPNLIITFSDNRPTYTDMLNTWRKKSNVVLFHEGYGDYSAINFGLTHFFGNYIYKFLLWPYHYNGTTRSYTGLYNNSFLLKPELLDRNFDFKKHKIPVSFFSNTFRNKTNFDISRNSIFVCFSGKDWLSGKRGLYFKRVLNNLNSLNKTVYLKVAPSQSQNKYFTLVSEFNNVKIITDDLVTSEAYCLHKNINVIVTDESSAVANAIFCGINKKILFLKDEVGDFGKYYSDPSDLYEFLIENKIIIKAKVDELVDLIISNNEFNSQIPNDESDLLKSINQILMN